MIASRIRSFFDPDRLNPIIIKEVRQGNRSRAFLLNFLLAHIGMIVLIISMVSETSSGFSYDLDGMNRFFWMLFGFSLVVGVPLSGINAISQERAEARLDLLHLTRLSALKIVRGKWLALISQVLLITVSLVPYIVVRYYFGSVNIVEDLVVVAILLCASAFITGLCVSISAMSSALLRWLIIGFGLWMVLTVGGQVIQGYFAFDRSIVSSGLIDWKWLSAILLVQGFLVLAMAMEFGASTICPPAENHQSRIRILYLVQLLLLFGVVLLDREELSAVCLFMTCVTGIVVMIIALIQAPVALPSIYTPFVRLGGLGKVMGRFLLYPGYPSGFYFLVFSVLSLTGCIGLLFKDEDIIWAYLALFVPSVIGCFLLPLSLALLIPLRLNLLGRYMIIAGLLLLLGLGSMALSYTYGMFVSYLFILDPFANLFIISNKDVFSMNVYAYAIGSSAVTGLSIFFIFKRGIRWRRRERELEDTALALQGKGKVQPS